MVFGVSLRAAAALALGALLTIINETVMDYMIPLMGHPDHWLVEGFESVVEWDATILVIGAALMLIANGVVRGSGDTA